MTYREAFDYIVSLGAVPRRDYMKDPKGYGHYLERMQGFLDFVGNPEQRIPHYIHVAGTSGKGSVSTMLASILHTSHTKTGLLTTPHPTGLLVHTEVNGKPMTNKEFIEMVTFLKPRIEAYQKKSRLELPSVNELLTIGTLWHFAKKKVEWAVLEVGLGGRYDSTNVIPHKDVAVITCIGYDHMDLLGTTKEKIAYEKAGIITSACPVFTADQNKKVLKVIGRECKKQQAQLTHIVFNKLKSFHTLDGMDFEYEGRKYHLNVHGEHQVRNAILVIKIAESLGINSKLIARGLETARIPIRMEVVSKRPLIVFDGAHNEDKMHSTVDATTQLMKLAKTKNLHLVVGFSADKDILTMLRSLAALQPKTVAVTKATVNSGRAPAEPRTLLRQVQKLIPGATVTAHQDPAEALKRALKQAKIVDGLLVTGSMFLAGQLRDWWRSHI